MPRMPTSRRRASSFRSRGAPRHARRRRGRRCANPAAMVEIKVGEEFEFPTPKGKVNVKIVRALPDARLLPVPNGGFKPQSEDIPVADVPPLHPGIQILVAPPEGRLFRTWVYENPRDSIAGQDGELELGGESAFRRRLGSLALPRARATASSSGRGSPRKLGKSEPKNPRPSRSASRPCSRGRSNLRSKGAPIGRS